MGLFSLLTPGDITLPLLMSVDKMVSALITLYSNIVADTTAWDMPGMLA